MELKIASKDYVKDISKLMLKDLESPDERFPEMMILKLREHAQEDNLILEFSNPNLISFLAIDNNKVKGFIVGYKKEDHIYLDYVTGNNINTKKLLLDKFIEESKKNNMKYIKADTFDFFENKILYEQKGFKLIKQENITPNLEILWLKLDLNKKTTKASNN